VLWPIGDEGSVRLPSPDHPRLGEKDTPVGVDINFKPIANEGWGHFCGSINWYTEPLVTRLTSDRRGITRPVQGLSLGFPDPKEDY